MQFGWSVAKSAAATPLVTILSPPPSIKSCTIFAFATAWSGILYPFGLRWRFFLIFTSYVFVKEDEDSLFKRRTSFPRLRGQNSFSGLCFLKEVADKFMRRPVWDHCLQLLYPLENSNIPKRMSNNLVLYILSLCRYMHLVTQENQDKN